jgi:hypothetical protein
MCGGLCLSERVRVYVWAMIVLQTLSNSGQPGAFRTTFDVTLQLPSSACVGTRSEPYCPFLVRQIVTPGRSVRSSCRRTEQLVLHVPIE